MPPLSLVARSRPCRRDCSAPASGSSPSSANRSRCESEAMNCRTCQYDLSQCLDGRLPSGRRAVVMAHVAECDDCAQFWAELQSMQALVLRLPAQHVNASFREQLFERIQTGEGTPPAVFAQAVPVGAKIRYLLTGAAAAAAVLVAATMLRNPRSAVVGPQDVASSRSPAEGTPA